MQESRRSEIPTITIYCTKKSCAIRCLWMMEEMGLEYQHIPIDHKTGENRTMEALATATQVIETRHKRGRIH